MLKITHFKEKIYIKIAFFTKGISDFELMSGYSTVKDVKENKVAIKPSGNDKITLYGSVYVGYAIHSKVELKDNAKITESLYGGYANEKSATNQGT